LLANIGFNPGAMGNFNQAGQFAAGQAQNQSNMSADALAALMGSGAFGGGAPAPQSLPSPTQIAGAPNVVSQPPVFGNAGPRIPGNQNIPRFGPER
jgi:hypothetical protein